MGYFDISRYEGLARTEYVLDGSTVSSATLASMVTVVNAGTVSVQGNLTTPGGRITMSAPAATDSATIELPPSIGNTLGSLVGFQTEILGLRCASTRNIFELQSWQSSTARVGIIWDNASLRTAYISSGAETSTAVLKNGNFTTLDKTDLGFLAYTEVTANHFITSQIGGTEVTLPVQNGVLSGVRKCRVFFQGAGEVSFRQLRLTCFWGVQGESLRRVY